MGRPFDRSRKRMAFICLATRRGFTLVEVLIALTLGGFILTAAMMHLVSLGKIWTHDWSDRHYMHHKESLTTFLIRVFKEADSGFSSLGTTGNLAGLRWENPPGETTLDDPYLRFYLKQPPAVLISNPPLASSVVCYLVFDEEEGLSFLWYPLIATRDGEEEIEDIDDLYRTSLSRFVARIEYCYYDKEKEEWETEEDPLEENDKFVMPDFLKFIFRFDEDHEDDAFVSYVPLPPSEKDAPLF